MDEGKPSGECLKAKRNSCPHETHWVVDVATGRIVNAGCQVCADTGECIEERGEAAGRRRWYSYGAGGEGRTGARR